MKHLGNCVTDIKIAYIGGGSRGWAWGLMSDLASAADISGQVDLYDIDYEASKANEVIGNRYTELPESRSCWHYRAVHSLEEALCGADFVVISIIPGTFDEMERDIHLPEKYGIYQSVGDTTGPGGILRGLRAIPMFEAIAEAIRDVCPNAWVINYTNPMSVCMRTLYRVFPKIRAFGCCHEVFGTQKLLCQALEDMLGVHVEDRSEIKANVIGINHFTWITEARYRDIDLMPVYQSFCEKYAATGFLKGKDDNWMNNHFDCSHRVKMDLFQKHGAIAAAGDRHLAEFCHGKKYLADPKTVRSWGFSLTTVAWRKENLASRLDKSRKLVSSELPVAITCTGEEGVEQIRALLGLRELVTNVNTPNRGQIPDLPMDAVIETNAVFRAGSLTPVFAGPLPKSLHDAISSLVAEQELVVEAGLERNTEKAFAAFLHDPLVTLTPVQARQLWNEMLAGSALYLQSYRK